MCFSKKNNSIKFAHNNIWIVLVWCVRKLNCAIWHISQPQIMLNRYIYNRLYRIVCGMRIVPNGCDLRLCHNFALLSVNVRTVVLRNWNAWIWILQSAFVELTCNDWFNTRKCLKYAYNSCIKWDELCALMSVPLGHLYNNFSIQLFLISPMIDDQTSASTTNAHTTSETDECVVSVLKHAHHHKILNNRSLETNLKLHITIINVVIAAGLLLIVWCSYIYTKPLDVPGIYVVLLLSSTFIMFSFLFQPELEFVLDMFVIIVIRRFVTFNYC